MKATGGLTWNDLEIEYPVDEYEEYSESEDENNVEEETIVKFEIIDLIRNCHVYGPPLEDNH